MTDQEKAIAEEAENSVKYMDIKGSRGEIFTRYVCNFTGHDSLDRNYLLWNATQRLSQHIALTEAAERVRAKTAPNPSTECGTDDDQDPVLSSDLQEDQKPESAVMESWPEDGSPVDFEAMHSPLAKAARLFIKKGDGKYKGLGYPHAAHICPPPNEVLSPAGYLADREQGRTRLDAIITVAMQIGIEQGMRLEREAEKEKNRFKSIVSKATSKLLKDVDNADLLNELYTRGLKW